MKILCLANQMDPQVFYDKADQKFADADFVVCAGDLPFEYVDFAAEKIGKKTFYVCGDCDSAPKRNFLKAKSIDAKCVCENGLLIAGVSSPALSAAGEFSEFFVALKLLRLAPRLILNRIFKGRFLDIFVSHFPPKGVHDKNDAAHRGLNCLCRFVRIFKPRHLIHGHSHAWLKSDERQTLFEKTIVTNADGFYFVEV